MEPDGWAPEHSEALREYLACGMSYSRIADAINARFGTRYTRNATIGRGKRMGLASPHRPTAQSPRKTPPKPTEPSKRRVAKLHACKADPLEAPPTRARSEPVKLRCVGLRPRLVSLLDLEPDDCRYPYGGDKDDEAILFCGHRRLAGCSYCEPHFQLTRTNGCTSERAAGPVALQLVEAA